jgi:hypothetical protein
MFNSVKFITLKNLFFSPPQLLLLDSESEIGDPVQCKKILIRDKRPRSASHEHEQTYIFVQCSTFSKFSSFIL